MKSSTFTKESVGAPLIGALLRLPWEHVQRRMLAGLHEHGFGDLDAPHLRVLQYPGPDGARPSDLAARLRMSKQALNYMLGELESLDYLERRPDPGDLRSKRIALTPRGEAAIRAMREEVREVERDWERQLGAARLALLRETLLELAGSDLTPEDGRHRSRARDGARATRGPSA